MTPVTNDSPGTLDQRRARSAWDAIQRVKADRSQAKKFGGQAKKLPTRIMASGLGQALAFLKAKGYADGLLAELSKWIEDRLPQKPGESNDLLQRIVKGNSDFLRRATDEVMAYLLWLNRFAEAEGLTDEEDE